MKMKMKEMMSSLNDEKKILYKKVGLNAHSKGRPEMMILKNGLLKFFLTFFRFSLSAFLGFLTISSQIE